MLRLSAVQTHFTVFTQPQPLSAHVYIHKTPFLWQLEGSAVVTVGAEEIRLRRDETLLIPGGQEFLYAPSTESLTLSTVMDSANKDRPYNISN